MEELKNRKLEFKNLVEFAEGSIVSKQILIKKTGNITLFSFDKGQQLSEHTAPFDALVQIVEGNGIIIIDGEENILRENEAIIMPANIPHAVKADEKFKMLLTMIKSKD